MDLGLAARNTGCHIRICSCLSFLTRIGSSVHEDWSWPVLLPS